MKLLLTTDAMGGVWTYASDLAVALTRRGVDVVLAVMGPGEPVAPAGVRMIDTGLALDWLAERPEDVEAASERLASLAREVGADLVQLHAPALALGMADLPVPVVTVVHSCVATWWAALRGGPLPPELAWRADQARSGLANATLVIAPTAAFGEMVRAAYDLPDAPKVVLNGRAPHDVAAQDGVLGRPADFLVAVGRLWDEAKNIALLDEAAAQITVPVRAVGATSGPNGTGIALCHCEAVGSLAPEDVAALLAQAPIFTSPARYEPFGLAVVEAGQAGCALILSDIPTFRELWDGAALFVPPGDAGALAAAANQLVANPRARATLGEAARQRAARFTVDRTATVMLEHYGALLGAGEPASERQAA